MYSFYQGHNLSKSQSGYTLNQRNNSSTLGGTSILTEPQVVTLQREVDNYTRKLEQEKRRLFAIDETYDIVFKEYQQKKKELQELKETQHSTNTKKMHAQVKNFENKTEKMISQANTSTSENKAIQKQIDALRKERIKYLDIQKNFQEEIQKTNKLTNSYVNKSLQLQNKTFQAKDDIVQLKLQSEQEKKEYVKQFDQVQNQLNEEKRLKEQQKIQIKKENFDVNTDTEQILKRRLKKLINSNKEKDKVIQQYQKNLTIIDDAFTAIKHGSGITDIDEITNTFIKSEEQNYSLYTYVDILSQDIDNLQDQNAQLERQCQEQEEQNELRKKLLQGTPQDEQIKQKFKNAIAKKQEYIDEFRQQIDKIHPGLEKILIQLTESNVIRNKSEKLFEYKLGFDLSESNLENFLSDLEEYINILIDYKNSQLQDISEINHTLLIDEIPEKTAKPTKNFNLQLEDLHQTKDFSHMMNQIQQNQNLEQYPNLQNPEKYDDQKLEEMAQEILNKKSQK